MTITTTAAEIADLFGLGHDLLAPAARYNVAPSQPIPVVRVSNGGRELAVLRWGLIPYWNTNAKHSGFVNARAETLAEKPAFRDPFRARRCLIPASGFFEWKTAGKKKRPYLFRKAGGGLLACAGVWDRWDGPNGSVETVAILTVPANELVQPLHDRMPAILAPDAFAVWLDPRSRPADLLPLLGAFPADSMESWPVSERVNSVGVEEPGLTDRVRELAGPTWAQPSLFDDVA